jgi:hypothetical protein
MVNECNVGVLGEVIFLTRGSYLHRDLLPSEFLLRVLWINPTGHQARVSVPHPN